MIIGKLQFCDMTDDMGLHSVGDFYVKIPMLVLLYTLSSTIFSMLLVTLSSKTLIYIMNNKGPNTDPCGTPLKTDFQFETSPSTTTRFLLSVSQFSIQSIMPFPIVWAFNISINLWCGTLLKVF